MENVALWHERDISHSSVERVIMPDSTILVDYMLARVTDVVKNLIVYPEHMKRNMELTGGLVFSQRLLLALIEKGAQRKESYEAVQRNAMTAWKGRDRFPGISQPGPLHYDTFEGQRRSRPVSIPCIICGISIKFSVGCSEPAR